MRNPIVWLKDSFPIYRDTQECKLKRKNLKFLRILTNFVAYIFWLRTSYIHTIKNPEQFKQQLLLWAQQFDDVVWLDSNHYAQTYSSFDAVLAVDAFTSIQTDYHDGFEKLKEYQTITNDWIFG